MMTTMLFGCMLGLVFVATIKGIQHNNKVMKESAKLHEQNMKQIKINNLQVCQQLLKATIQQPKGVE